MGIFICMEKYIDVIKMYKDGISATEISKDLNIGRRTVYRILKKYNITLQCELIKEVKKCLICSKECVKSLCGSCNTNLRRYRVKKLAVEYLGGKCKCGWCGDLSGFDFHHTNPKYKEFNPCARTLANMTWVSAKEELDKCELLCALCHRLEHTSYGKLEEISLIYSGKTFV